MKEYITEFYIEPEGNVERLRLWHKVVNRLLRKQVYRERIVEWRS